MRTIKWSWGSTRERSVVVPMVAIRTAQRGPLVLPGFDNQWLHPPRPWWLGEADGVAGGHHEISVMYLLNPVDAAYERREGAQQSFCWSGDLRGRFAPGVEGLAADTTSDPARELPERASRAPMLHLTIRSRTRPARARPGGRADGSAPSTPSPSPSATDFTNNR